MPVDQTFDSLRRADRRAEAASCGQRARRNLCLRCALWPQGSAAGKTSACFGVYASLVRGLAEAFFVVEVVLRAVEVFFAVAVVLRVVEVFFAVEAFFVVDEEAVLARVVAVFLAAFSEALTTPSCSPLASSAVFLARVVVRRALLAAPSW